MFFGKWFQPFHANDKVIQSLISNLINSFSFDSLRMNSAHLHFFTEQSPRLNGIHLHSKQRFEHSPLSDQTFQNIPQNLYADGSTTILNIGLFCLVFSDELCIFSYLDIIYSIFPLHISEKRPYFILNKNINVFIVRNR